MKKILLAFAFLAFTTGINAQTYFSDDFSSGNLDNWTLLNADGDAFEWTVADYDDGVQEEHASSWSWDAGTGPLTPDNWMTSAAIDMTTASAGVTLSWKVYAQDQDWADENYSVYAALYNDIDSLMASPVTFTEVVGASDGYQTRFLDMSAFVGESNVFVSFRHHDVSDMFRLNIDDVRVYSPVDNDMAIAAIAVDNTSDGDRTFTITCTNNGALNATAFDVDWTFDGSAATTVNVTGVDLATGDSFDVIVNVDGVTEGAKTFSAEITTSDDDMSNNASEATYNFAPPIMQFIGTDSDGNAFNLYESLSSGQAILLDFMASWCGPCESSTPEISEWIQDNGSGNGIVQAIAITVEASDDNSVLNGLNWNGGFYHYPKFAYTAANDENYFHYATDLALNEGGFIPFFILICPNVDDPAHSTIIKSDVGFVAGQFAAYETELNGCASATFDNTANGVDNMTKKEAVISIYPNPINQFATVNISLIENSSVTVDVINALGQTVLNKNLSNVSGLQNMMIDMSSFEDGMYLVNVMINGVLTTKRISVIK